MKPPEQVLLELASDRITFDGGRGKKILTKLNAWRLILSIVCNGGDARIGERIGNERKGRMAREVLRWVDAQRLCTLLIAVDGHQDWTLFKTTDHCGSLSVRSFARFESLSELIKYYEERSQKKA